MKIINPQASKSNVNSVSTPSAQYNKVLTAGTSYSAVLKRCQGIISVESSEPVVLKAVIEVLLLNGCRISELLKVTGNDITSSGHIIIKGSKGSNSRVLTTNIYKQFWINRRKNSDSVGSVYSRFYFYHNFKRLGINIKSNYNENHSVTHALRHILINELSESTEDLSIIKNHVGHRQIQNTRHYLKNKKSSEKKKNN